MADKMTAAHLAARPVGGATGLQLTSRARHSSAAELCANKSWHCSWSGTLDNFNRHCPSMPFAFCESPRKDRPIFSAYLEAFTECESLRSRVLAVLHLLPEAVQRDFLDDPRFRVTLENYVPGEGWSLWMASPGPIGSGSRCVVLRPKLADCPEAFAHYVIAHEFAHAFLHNGGWGDITDIEVAADALAASWGFHRPADSFRRTAT